MMPLPRRFFDIRHKASFCSNRKRVPYSAVTDPGLNNRQAEETDVELDGVRGQQEKVQMAIERVVRSTYELIQQLKLAKKYADSDISSL